MAMQQQQPPQTQTIKRPLDLLEKALGGVSAVFGSAGFLYFWMQFRPLWHEARLDILVARLCLLAGLLIAALAGITLLSRARRLASNLLRGAAVLGVVIFGYALYDILRRSAWRFPPSDLIVLGGVFAATFWMLWAARYVKQREQEDSA